MHQASSHSRGIGPGNTWETSASCVTNLFGGRTSSGGNVIDGDRCCSDLVPGVPAEITQGSQRHFPTSEKLTEFALHRGDPDQSRDRSSLEFDKQIYVTVRSEIIPYWGYLPTVEMTRDATKPSRLACTEVQVDGAR